MKKLTFKQYIESKEQLREQLLKTPIHSVTYSVKRYCKLVVGESKETKQHVTLKPKQTIIVEWLYEDIDNPKPLKIQFENVDSVDSDKVHAALWSGTKLLGWLGKNTFED